MGLIQSIHGSILVFPRKIWAIFFGILPPNLVRQLERRRPHPRLPVGRAVTVTRRVWRAVQPTASERRAPGSRDSVEVQPRAQVRGPGWYLTSTSPPPCAGSEAQHSASDQAGGAGYSDTSTTAAHATTQHTQHTHGSLRPGYAGTHADRTRLHPFTHTSRVRLRLHYGKYLNPEFPPHR
jgi:hypothetical protein